MIRFLHTADWQIGTPFGQFEPEIATLLSEARFDVVERIAALATQQGVDAVLVAGDVFDMHTVTDRIIRRMFAAMSGFTGTWVLIPGNHDAAIPESVWTRAGRLNCITPNVKVVTRPEIVPIGASASVLAAPLVQRRTFDDTTDWFDTAETPEEHVRIGLAHGSISNYLPDSVESTNPIANDRVQRARLDYLALGDWHGALNPCERTWYAGTPETDRFRNNRSGWVLEVAIDAPGADPQVTQHAVGRYTWHSWEENLVVPTDVEALEERLRTLTARDVVHLTVVGTLDMAASACLEAAIESAAARCRALRSDLTGLRMAPTLEDIAALGASHGYLTRVVEQLKAAQDDPQTGSTATEALLILSRLASLPSKVTS